MELHVAKMDWTATMATPGVKILEKSRAPHYIVMLFVILIQRSKRFLELWIWIKDWYR